ncbi:MAG: zf-HC2 domain-containing protein [Myxococcaceae bacterium]
MTCDELDTLLNPYVDGELQAVDCVDLEQHLSTCEGCMRRVMHERLFRETLRQKFFGDPEQPLNRAPDALRYSIQGGIRREVRRHQLRQALTLSAAAAVVAAIGAGSYALWPQERDRFLEDAARRHARALPAEITDAAHETVEAWFGGKLDHRVPVPRFPNARVSGARISNVTDRPAAYISYKAPDTEGNPRTIGLFVFDDTGNDVEAKPLPRVEVDRRLGYNVALWRDGEIVYEMVTDLDEHDIRALLEAQQERPRDPRLPTATPPSSMPVIDVKPASLQP